MLRDWNCYSNLTGFLEVILIFWCKFAFVAALQKNSSGFTTTCNFSDGSVYNCEHGGLCGPNKTCHCQAGYYGHSCEDQVVTTVIVVLICVMPPICWTVLCIYGCKNYDSSQRRQMDSGSRSFHTDDESVPAGLNDQPPCYNDVTNPFHHSIRSHHIDHCGNTDHPPAYDEVMKAFRSIKNSRKSSKVNTSTISLGSKNSAFSFELDDIEMAQEV